MELICHCDGDLKSGAIMKPIGSDISTPAGVPNRRNAEIIYECHQCKRKVVVSEQYIIDKKK